MDSHAFERNELLAQTVIKGLNSRNMTGYYAKDREEAKQIALSLIPEGSSVTQGGCMSSREIGLVDAIEEGNYHFIDRDKMDPREALLAAYDADVFLASANAMTDDGILVNIDGNANRVSCIANGPRKVIFIVGMNKVCPDLDSAIKRARNVAAPANALRFPVNTPCKKTGKCYDCKQPDTICCQFLITRYSKHKDRIHVILVNDFLGF
ncbi:MAG: lactate utilization protein [Lachnospiraceae bacterium]|jgi:L-lactate utilization protein LutB|nr:lactate utilization protein [Lachnospiraceae bacterium]